MEGEVSSTDGKARAGTRISVRRPPWVGPPETRWHSIQPPNSKQFGLAPFKERVT